MRWSTTSETRAWLALALASLVALPESAAQFRTPSATAQPRGGQGCSFVVVAGIYFGTYDDGAQSPVYTTATFQVKCTGIGHSDVTFASGPSAVTGDFQSRRMRGPGTSELGYQLYTNSSRTVVWGDGTRDTSPIVIHQSGANKQALVYGEIFGGQDGEEGEYADTIVVTVLP